LSVGSAEFFFGAGESLLSFGQEPDISAGFALPVGGWPLGFRCIHEKLIAQA